MCQVLQFPKCIKFSFTSCLGADYIFSLECSLILFTYQLLSFRPGANPP